MDLVTYCKKGDEFKLSSFLQRLKKFHSDIEFNVIVIAESISNINWEAPESVKYYGLTTGLPNEWSFLEVFRVVGPAIFIDMSTDIEMLKGLSDFIHLVKEDPDQHLFMKKCKEGLSADIMGWNCNMNYLIYEWDGSWGGSVTDYIIADHTNYRDCMCAFNDSQDNSPIGVVI